MNTESEPEQPLIPVEIPISSVGQRRRTAEDFWPERASRDIEAPVDAGVMHGPKTRDQLADELIAANLKENAGDIALGYNPKVAHGRTALHLMNTKVFTGEETGAALEVIGARAKELRVPAHRVSVNIAQLTTAGMEAARERQRPLDVRERQAGPSAQ